MEATTLKYTVIKDKSQYDQYCRQLEELLEGEQNEAVQDEIDLLTLLIEKYDEEHNTFTESDPIALLRSFMKDRGLKSQHLVEVLGVSKGYVSDILNYKKGLSKEVIRKLAEYFKVRQEAFNRYYKLMPSTDTYTGNFGSGNTAKQIHAAKH
ncbi:type II toxin-antitoxin system HigA family antitoxin [Arcticibacter sp. MXS-1]|uniref:helix-turn-helix domain-containing protein n=1 Tax=Arcticibacter sp. MXS-1 TaxID=3341726 RepID=UPI0035A957E4